MSNPLYLPLLEAIIISYARPFTDNEGVGKLPKKWFQFDSERFAQAHENILKYRNDLVAHTDKNARKIQIVPPNSLFIPTPKGMKPSGIGFRIRTYWIEIRQIQVYCELSAFQTNRLWKEAEKLFNELYENMELPNKEFDLRIDEGL